MNKLIIIGLCLWIPIWIGSFIPIAQWINRPKNWYYGLIVFIIMIIGIVLTFIGVVIQALK